MKKKGKVILGVGIGTVLLAGTLALGVIIAPKIQEELERREVVEYAKEVHQENLENPKFEATDIVADEPVEIITENGIDYATGKLRNASTKADAEYIEIVYNCYDYEGNYLGQISDMTFGLKQGDTWKFKAMLYYDDTQTIELDDIYFK